MLKKRYPLLILFCSCVFFACTKVDIQFGDQFLDNGYTQVIKVDSFTVDVSTVYVDSFITSSKGVTLIGSHNDPAFGRITINNFLEVTPPAYVDSFAGTSFDSLTLVLKPTKSYYGDTGKPVHLDVNRLSEPIVGYDDDLFNMYNTRQFAVFTTAIGSADVMVRPNQTDSIIIRLNDNLGKELLKKLQDPNDADMQTTVAFVQYFNGLRISSGTNSSMIFGCKDSVIMRLHYKQPGLYVQNKTWDFYLTNKNHHFNNINVDRSGTPLKDLAALKQINSTATNNTAYTMYAAGAMAKLRFPTIRDLYKLPNFAKIVKATLLVRPLKGSYSPFYFLPPQLRLVTTTTLNQIGADIVSVNSTGTAATETGDLTVDYLYGENTNYAYDLTRYLKSIITDASYNGNGLLLIPSSPALETEFGRLVMGNRLNTNGQMQLIIVYASVQ